MSVKSTELETSVVVKAVSFFLNMLFPATYKCESILSIQEN